jgi:hypothetical protein
MLVYEALLQLHFLDHYTKQKIVKDMWKQSLSKKTQFQTSNLHSRHQDQNLDWEAFGANCIAK